MPRVRQFPLPSILPVGRSRGRHCPRPQRVIRRAVWRARLRAALSVAGAIGVIGVVAVGGFWFLRGPMLEAGADALLAAESLFMAGGAERLPTEDVARPAESATAIEAGSVPAIKAVLVR